MCCVCYSTRSAQEQRLQPVVGHVVCRRHYVRQVCVTLAVLNQYAVVTSARRHYVRQVCVTLAVLNQYAVVTSASAEYVRCVSRLLC